MSCKRHSWTATGRYTRPAGSEIQYINVTCERCGAEALRHPVTNRILRR